jgi:hypothetical protein
MSDQPKCGGFSFGDYPISTSELIEEVRLGLCGIPANGLVCPSTRIYTLFVIATLAEIGSKRKLHTYPYKAHGNREFLWDASWWLESDEYLELVFAAESEWGDCWNVKYDFEKLLVAKCPLKLMVTDFLESIPNAEKLNKALQRYNCHIQGEQYLRMEVKGSLTGGEIYFNEYSPDQSGPDRNAQFKRRSGHSLTYSFGSLVSPGG